MKIAFISHHLPHPQSSSAGRQLFAVVEAMRRAGHDAVVTSWGDGLPRLEAPAWCDRRPLSAPPRSLRRLPHTLLNPRSHVRALGWRPPEDGVPIADNRDSAPALPADRRTGAVLHHSVRLDAAATGARSPAAVQEWRAERRAARRATRTAALSGRVATVIGADVVLDATVPLPSTLLDPVERPVALMLADWSWSPNLIALEQLLAVWPSVRMAVTGAELLIAGRGGAAIAGGDGVRVVGEVRDTAEVMAESALLVFPCPASSGPKLKVLDAALHGLPVLTTAAGVEGLAVDGVTVAPLDGFEAALAGLLADPGRRADSARRAREAALARHVPDVAVRSWLSFAADLADA